jgi:hypothetical protein
MVLMVMETITIFSKKRVSDDEFTSGSMRQLLVIMQSEN